MIKLNEYEEHLKDKKELVYHWLYTKEITYEEITNMYVSQIELEREYYKGTLAKSDVYIATFIDNKTKDMNKQRPFAIKYMIEHKRLQGSKWYDDLVNKVSGSDKE